MLVCDRISRFLNSTKWSLWLWSWEGRWWVRSSLSFLWIFRFLFCSRISLGSNLTLIMLQERNCEKESSHLLKRWKKCTWSLILLNQQFNKWDTVNFLTNHSLRKSWFLEMLWENLFVLFLLRKFAFFTIQPEVLTLIPTSWAKEMDFIY